MGKWSNCGYNILISKYISDKYISDIFICLFPFLDLKEISGQSSYFFKNDESETSFK